MSFRLMLLILFAFLYFGIGIGTLLKFNASVSGIIARVKLILLLPFQMIFLTLMVYFDILPDKIHSSIKKAKCKNKVLLLKDILFYIIYIFCMCMKFTPIMSAMLAKLIIEQNKTQRASKNVLTKAKSQYSDMIGELTILCN